MISPLRVVFLGTPQFSVPTFQALLDSPEVEILGVITQPDRPAGRGQKLAAPPIKLLAEAAGLPVFQPKSLRKDASLIQWIRDQKPDFLVTIAFGQILSQEVLDIPSLGTVNVHASLLPKYRGANPIQWALLNGEQQTGLTTMLTDIGVDTGEMLLKETLAITTDDTAVTVTEKLSAMGGPLLLKTLTDFARGVLKSVPQPHDKATHAPKLTKEAAWLDWGQSAETLHRKIRGQQPWPGAVTLLGGERIKIFQSRYTSEGLGESVGEAGAAKSEDFVKNRLPGTILGMIKEDGQEGLRVQTGQGTLDLLWVQPPGKAKMPAKAWALGALRDLEFPRFESPEVQALAEA